MAAAVGANVWSGTTTIPAAKPGIFGEVEVTLSEGLAATDKVVASISHSSEQTTTSMKFKDFNFQIIKNAGDNKIKFKSLVEQNPEVKVDYFVVAQSTV